MQHCQQRQVPLERLANKIAVGVRAGVPVFHRDAPTVDYFATSLPNFLLFDDDLSKRNQIECLFLDALANLGLGSTAGAISDLRQVLSLDGNHLWAQVELECLNASTEEVGSRQ